MANNNYNPYNQQPPYQQPQYPQPQYQPTAYDKTSEVMSVGQYILMFILSAIPVVNVICWIVWLVSPNTNKNKKNYIIAVIVLWAIAIILGVVVGVIAGVAGVDLMSQF